MYKFYDVTFENRSQHRSLLSDFFNSLNLEYEQEAIDDYDTQTARYILAEDTEHGFIGGVRLLPSMGPKLSDLVLSEMGIGLFDDDTWEMTKLGLNIDSPALKSTSSAVFDEIIDCFFFELMSFISNQTKIASLMTLLPETSHQDLSSISNWGFDLESMVGNPFNTNKTDYVLGVVKIPPPESFALAS